ncbi:putative C-mannosyltransferase DPY19L3 [Liparis tanakae]|uniref:Putative C-mannosyltransferase DPY19L3 n=1 Tax=Liparis tanakae TaxID=230148 RepID=A0A4Z2H0M1_9TELE|nr:putative C-mannosyltransferase DPY19L3 [Liparis tanakae]
MASRASRMRMRSIFSFTRHEATSCTAPAKRERRPTAGNVPELVMCAWRPSVVLFLVGGLKPLQDFDASLYLCEEAFGLLPLDTLERLAGTLLLYPYALTLLLLSAGLAAAALHNLR